MGGVQHKITGKPGQLLPDLLLVHPSFMDKDVFCLRQTLSPVFRSHKYVDLYRASGQTLCQEPPLRGPGKQSRVPDIFYRQTAHRRYPLGVTMAPESSMVWLFPTKTVVNISAS